MGADYQPGAAIRRVNGQAAVEDLNQKFFPPQMDIVNGPSKFDLSVALFHGENNRNQVLVTFMLKEPINGVKQVQAYINGISREDGSGENWIFTGYMPEAIAKKFAGKYQQTVSGYFSTKRRTGHMKFTRR